MAGVTFADAATARAALDDCNTKFPRLVFESQLEAGGETTVRATRFPDTVDLWPAVQLTHHVWGVGPDVTFPEFDLSEVNWRHLAQVMRLEGALAGGMELLPQVVAQVCRNQKVQLYDADDKPIKGDAGKGGPCGCRLAGSGRFDTYPCGSALFLDKERSSDERRVTCPQCGFDKNFIGIETVRMLLANRAAMA